MKLTNTCTATECTKLCFEDIKAGEIFFDPVTKIPFLKLRGLLEDTEGIGEEFNAIDLRSGEGVRFGLSEAVGRFRNEPELVYSSKDVIYEK